jgi:adenosylcobinamide-GDP ribazoletransferase
MSDHDEIEVRQGFRAGDIRIALGLLTRLPGGTMPRARAPAAAAWAYPLAGLVVALVALVLAGLADWIGLPPVLVALTVIAAQVAATGALHEDGLADCADGFWGGWDRARRLEIMKDSHAGTYGMLALILALGFRWGALWQLTETGSLAAGVIVAAIMSRGAMVWTMHSLPHARAGGLSRATGRPGRPTALAAVGLAVLVAPFAPGFMLWPLLVAALSCFGVMALARERIGGQTGDVLGATQQVTEIAVLLILAAIVAPD